MNDFITNQAKKIEKAEADFAKRCATLLDHIEHNDGCYRIRRSPTEPAILFEIDRFLKRSNQLVGTATLNRSQRHDCALHINTLAERLGANPLAIMHSILIGAGGSGKTHTVNAVLRPLVVELLGPATERGLCMANSACRVLGQNAMTVHKGIVARRKQPLNAKEIGNDKRTEASKLFWEHALALVLDEFGMLGADLFHSLLQTIGMGKDKVNGYDKASYLKEPFGRIASVHLQGDFMQLPPVMRQGVRKMNDYIFLNACSCEQCDH